VKFSMATEFIMDRSLLRQYRAAKSRAFETDPKAVSATTLCHRSPGMLMRHAPTRPAAAIAAAFTLSMPLGRSLRVAMNREFL